MDNALTGPLARRTVLTAAAATGLLAACGTTGGEDGSAGGGASPTPADSASQAAGKVLAAASDVPVGGGIIDKDGQYVVTQPTAGEYRAFSSVCPHQQCDVSRVEDNRITCACHGSRFSAETGDVEAGPAARGLAEIPVVLEGDSIVRA